MAASLLDQRPKISEAIYKLNTLGDQEFLELMDEYMDEIEKSVGFRSSERSTQNRQDRHLRQYQNFVVALFLRDRSREDLTDEELNAACFPDDHNELAKRLKFFLRFMICHAKPRRRHASHISFTTAAQYRGSMIFWTYRMWDGRNTPAPNRRWLWNRMSEMINATGRKLGITRLASDDVRPYLGLAEMDQLMEYDLRNCMSVPYAEQHHLAWCLGRMCALRPGSLGRPDAAVADAQYQADHLQWRDVKIFRSREEGRFRVELHVRNLKGNASWNWEKASENKSVRFQINSPQTQEAIPFSIPHRFLQIALRRGALESYDDMESLLCGNKHEILIKPEFLDKPVFYAGREGGRGLHESNPLRASKFTEYLKERGLAVGYPLTLTFYALRRRTATDIAKAFGPEIARQVMGHNANTRTLEKNYLDMLSTLDVSAAQLGEDIVKGHQSLVSEESKLALQKLSSEQLEKVSGGALNALIGTLISQDPNFPWHGTAHEAKLYRRRVRKIAHEQLLAEQHRARQHDMTVDEHIRRQNLVADAAEFSNRVVRHALDQLKNCQTMAATAGPEVDSADPGEDEDTDFVERRFEPPEDDIEDQALPPPDGHGVINITCDTGELDQQELEPSDLSYVDCVRSFFLLMVDPKPANSGPKQGQTMVKCQQCQEDDSVELEDREKIYTLGHLTQHLTAFHSPYRALLRRIHRELETRGVVSCPYCLIAVTLAESTDPDDRRVKDHESTTSLMRHLRTSNAERIQGAEAWMRNPAAIEEHEALMVAYGWRSPTFKGMVDFQDEQVTARKKTMRSHVRDFESYRSDFDQTDSEDHSSIEGAKYGGRKTRGILPDDVEQRVVRPLDADLDRAALLGNISDEELESEYGITSDVSGPLPIPRRRRAMFTGLEDEDEDAREGN